MPKEGPSQNLPFSPGQPGEITAMEAWRVLGADIHAALIDVRTPEEWKTVGAPDLSAVEKRPVFLSWIALPGSKKNPRFEKELAERFPQKNTPMLFMCRSGGRSRQAAEAMIRYGHTHCLNVVNGFEGADSGNPLCNGWQASGLPWRKNG